MGEEALRFLQPERSEGPAYAPLRSADVLPFAQNGGPFDRKKLKLLRLCLCSRPRFPSLFHVSGRFFSPQGCLGGLMGRSSAARSTGDGIGASSAAR